MRIIYYKLILYLLLLLLLLLALMSATQYLLVDIELLLLQSYTRVSQV